MLDGFSGAMPQVSTQEFKRLRLRVHTFLAGVPLHDVWSVDLPHWRGGVTLDDFLRTESDCLCTPPSLVRMLLDIRFFVGRFFGCDHEPAPTVWKTFATRLTETDSFRKLIVYPSLLRSVRARWNKAFSTG